MTDPGESQNQVVRGVTVNRQLKASFAVHSFLSLTVERLFFTSSWALKTKAVTRYRSPLMS